MSRSSVTASAAVELAFLFRNARPSRPVLLLGAGASYRSGIPLAAEAVRRIARAAFARRVLGVDYRLCSPKPSDWVPFLEGQPWFIRDPERLAENFPTAVANLLTPREFRREFFLDIVQPPNGINAGYRHLADLMMRGLCWTVLTTNFDTLVVDALRERSPHIRRVCEINRAPDDLVQFDVFRRNQVAYLHGAVELYTDKNLEEETTHLDPRLVLLLRPLLAGSPLIVVGYRGVERSVMTDLLEAGADPSGGYRHGVYWCVRRGEKPHPNVEQLGRRIGSNFRLLEIDGFDELMAELVVELKDEDLHGAVHPAAPGAAPSAADEQPLAGASLADLDHGLLLATLARYAERLHRAPVTKDNFRAIMVEQGLLCDEGGVLVPTRGCYLLFGSDVPGRFPEACVAVTRAGRQRRLFIGNLITQYRALLDYLDSEEINPTLRLKRATSSEERRAFPTRALLELVVNLLVHRDYLEEDFSSIDVVPGERLVFRNAGGVPEGVRRHLSFDHDGHFRPVRNVTAFRNPSLADVFYGLGPMDKAGTGLADVHECMLENGGDASFAIEAGNHGFCATLLQPVQAAPAKSRVARPISPVGLYVTNLIPFAIVPETVSFLPLRSDGAALAPLLSDAENPGDLPIFIRHRGRLLTFADLGRFPEFIARRGRPEDVERLPVAEILGNTDDRRLFVWLLRKHWEFYLHRFTALGLRLEPGKHRAFFRLLQGDRNTVTYDSVKRRRVRRDVVKQRGTGRRVWYENEGVAYQVVDFDGTWAIQLKPFYMFTGSDGASPLSAFERTARATRRMRFDRNRNVDDDLSFWARFLSGAEPTMNLGGIGVEDLVLHATYHTVEVPEFGLEDQSGANADRMPA